MKFKNSFPKVNYPHESVIWGKLQKFKVLSSHLTGNNITYFHNAPRYWIRAMDFVPYFWNERDGEQVSSHLKTLKAKSSSDQQVIIGLINSSLFYWWFVLLSNCRDFNLREIENFPIGLDVMSNEIKEKLALLTDKLMLDLQKNAYRKTAFYKATGKVEYDEFYPRLSKPIIDKIDRVLAEHYGFTDEELDFIINYDIKYRMGDSLEGEEA